MYVYYIYIHKIYSYHKFFLVYLTTSIDSNTTYLININCIIGLIQKL